SYSAPTWANMEKALGVANTVLNDPEASEEQVKAAVEGLQASIEKLEVKVPESSEVNPSPAVKPGDTPAKGNAIKTGDTTSMISALGLMSSLSVIAYLKKKRINRNK
ncbi:LPXTG cell wall anchor domain-containing protein, partial [Thomasclavelia sp.]